MTAHVPSGRPTVLTVIAPGGQRSRTPVIETPFLVGRQSGNHLVLRDNRVSRVHARIANGSGGYWIEDANSRHGTFLNGRRITQAEKLFPGDTISFGVPDGYEVVFEQEEGGDLSRLVSQFASSGRAPGGGLVKLGALVEVARAVQGSLSVHEVLEAVVDAALTVTGCERGFLFLSAPAGLELRVARDNAGNTLSRDDLAIPSSTLQDALRSRRELFAMTVEAGRGHSIGVPLVKVRTGVSQETMHAALAESLGLLYLDARADLGEMTAGNQDILQTLALEASTVIENARLLEQERAKQRLDEELRIAREIQRTLLPASLPRDGWFRAAASSTPSLQVGGDYYDAIRSAPDAWVFLLADVSGKGVSSGLMASLLQGALLVAPHDAPGIERLLGRLDAYLYERAEGEKYATLFYACLHRDGEFLWCGCGHGQAAIVMPGGEIRALGSTALPIGMLGLGRFPVRSERLPAGAKVVVYSDGLTDAENPSGAGFGAHRVEDAIRAGAALDAKGLHDAIVAAVDAFSEGTPRMDDLTLFVAEYLPASAT